MRVMAACMHKQRSKSNHRRLGKGESGRRQGRKTPCRTDLKCGGGVELALPPVPGYRPKLLRFGRLQTGHNGVLLRQLALANRSASPWPRFTRFDMLREILGLGLWWWFPPPVGRLPPPLWRWLRRLRMWCWPGARWLDRFFLFRHLLTLRNKERFRRKLLPNFEFTLAF
jgi:hypothetical protein